MLRLYLQITRALGGRRRFIRRLAGMALILLGVHAAADLIDDVVYRFIDAVDLAIDSAAWWLFEGMANLGTISEKTAVEWGEGFAGWLEVAQKDKVALTLALLLELLVDLLLFDFAWGLRKASGLDEEPKTMVDELRESALELKAAFWPLDLERLAVLPTLFAFSCSGTLLAGLAIESILADVLGRLFPLWLWGINVAAAAGLLGAAVLIWRFLPDMLHGAILRAHQRGERYEEETAFDPEESSTTELWRRRLKRARRGAFMVVALLPLAYVSLLTQSAFFGLIQRTGAGL